MGNNDFARDEAPRRILTMVRWLLYLTFVVIGYLILNRIGPVVAPILAAAAVAYLLDGAVDWLEAKGVHRVTAVALFLIAFLAVVTAVLIVVIPLVSVELSRFVVALPDFADEAIAWVGSHLGVEVPASWRDYVKGSEFEHLVGNAAGPLAALAASVLGGLLSLLGFLAEMLLVPVFAFYILLDWDHIVARTHSFVPARHRDVVADIVREIDSAVSTWIRGQLVVVSLLAALYAASFKIIGINLGVTIGIVVGLLTIIPFLGTAVGAAITVVVILLDYHGPGELIAVGGVFVVLHLLEAAVLTPKIVGKKVGLGELGALFAVLAGGKLLGFTGVLLAVPLAASVAVLVRRGLRIYERSDFYNEGSATGVPADEESE